MYHVLAAVAASDPVLQTSPWWAKVVTGFTLLVVGIGMAWARKQEKLDFGDFDFLMDYGVYIIMVAGVGVILWGLGVNFN